MKKYIRIELNIAGRVVAFSEYKITDKTTIDNLLKKLKRFLKVTS